MSTHDLPFVHVCILISSFYKVTSHIRSGTTLLTSFKLNDLFKDPTSQYNHILRYQRSGFQHRNLKRGYSSFHNTLFMADRSLYCPFSQPWAHHTHSGKAWGWILRFRWDSGKHKGTLPFSNHTPEQMLPCHRWCTRDSCQRSPQGRWTWERRHGLQNDFLRVPLWRVMGRLKAWRTDKIFVPF